MRIITNNKKNVSQIFAFKEDNNITFLHQSVVFSSNLKLFESKHIRTVWNEPDQKWYFVVEDVVLALTESKDTKQYIKRMRQRDVELAKGWVQFVPTLWVETAGGKQRMGCANAKGLLRIIQSIPSPKAEPVKQ